MIETETETPNQSALLTDLLFNKISKAHENLHGIDKRGRGRPKKHNIPEVVGKQHHKMSDEEEPVRTLTFQTQRKIQLDYREFAAEGYRPKDAIEKLCELYKIPYSQAFNICADEI